MPTDRLSDAACRAAKPRERAYKLFDGAGLALVVLPSGARSWRLFCRVDGKQRTLTLGLYPEVTLAAARQARAAARERMRVGEDPSPSRRPAAAAKALVTVKQACEAYWRGRQDTTAGYRANALRALELHVWPTLGATPVRDLTRDAVLGVLAAMDAKGLHVYVRKVRVWLGQVLAWAVEHGQATANVCALIDPRRAFGRRTVEHHAALELADVPALMARLASERELQSVLGCRLLALTWVRTAELRMMQWDELDGDLWRLPAGRMKRRRDHLVPMSRQALAIIETLRARAGASVYVFPAEHRPDRPMSENAILYLLARIGYGGRMTGHGWRTVASTWAHEHGYPPDVIERQLAHAPDDKVRAAYNRAAYLEARRAMLQKWADWLLPGPSGS